MFSIYFRLVFSFIYFKVLKQSKQDVFASILKKFKNHQEPKCFAMVYNPYANVQLNYPIFTILFQSFVYLFLMHSKQISFKQGEGVSLNTPMLQYGKYGCLFFNISEFQEYAKSQGYYVVYVYSSDRRCLTVMSQITASSEEYRPNKYVVGNFTPFFFGEKNYIYSMVLRDFKNFDFHMRPIFFQKFESTRFKSKLDAKAGNGISYFIKSSNSKRLINNLSEISNPEKVVGYYFGKEYSFQGFKSFLESLGYDLTDDLMVVKY